MSNGWKGSKAWDMVEVYDCVSIAERQRIEKLEMLDEAELLVQLFQHYCIAIAWTSFSLLQDGGGDADTITTFAELTLV